jgi:hypothetical protein
VRALRLLLLCAIAATLVAGAPAFAASPPAHYRLSAEQATRIALHSADGRQLLRTAPGAHAIATRPDAGLWQVRLVAAGRTAGSVLVEDRAARTLEASPWAWPRADAGPMNAFKTEVELAMLALAAIFAAALADLRRIASWRNADVLAILSLGVSFALYDRGHPLVSVPLLYPPLIYLAARMVALGLGRGRRTVRGPSTRVLGALLVAAVAVRVGFHMLLGQTTDVTYAGVFGADSILHGWPLYVADNGHLDTYGPAAYLAYVPASLLWPMTDWARGALTAGRATALVVDLATIAALLRLGPRVRGGEEGRRLGLLLALAFAASPWTFLNVALSTNDGLVALALVALLYALNRPALRGAILGIAAATKLAPLALIGLVARGSWRAAAVTAAAMAATIAVLVAAVHPTSLGVVYDNVVGFQLQRRSFLSIWGQYPQLEPLKPVLEAALLACGAAVALRPRKLDLAQTAALGAGLLVAIQLVAQYWTYTYAGWAMPMIAAAVLVPAQSSVTARAAAVRRLPAATAATPAGSSA